MSLLSRPKVSFFLYSIQKPIQTGSDIWAKPLPTGRKESLKSRNDRTVEPVSHGDYFQAARSFLERNDFEIVIRALAARRKQKVAPDDIEEIRICLVKHGEFYHPAKIEIIARNEIIPFVLNVAVTAVGIDCLVTEYPLLERLNNDFPFSFLPNLYGRGEVLIKEKDLKIGMFLGEWFEGFNEFHISRDPNDKKNKIQVWNAETGNFFLTADQAKSVYRQAAMILTCYYNIHTFEQIFSWHHAAGDFVLRRHQDKIDVRLITVRKYLLIFKNQAPDDSLLMPALLIFFLDLSVRMRLDRLDGVGGMVWSDHTAVEGTVEGFFQGLSRKKTKPVACGIFSAHFRKISCRFQRKRSDRIIERYCRSIPSPFTGCSGC